MKARNAFDLSFSGKSLLKTFAPEIPNAQTSLSVPDPAGYICRKIDA
jgi:hypothetical protein